MATCFNSAESSSGLTQNWSKVYHISQCIMGSQMLTMSNMVGAVLYVQMHIIFYNGIYLTDRLCGLVVRVSGYRYRGLGFDSRRTRFSE